MNPGELFVEPPRVEWHHRRPFAFARMPLDYAHRLERMAHEHAPSILRMRLPTEAPDEGQTPTARRYASYNAFLLDGAALPLFLAIRETYRTLVRAIEGERRNRFIKCWYNISTTGQAIAPHQHEAIFIGTFAARAVGSVTRYRSPEGNADHVVEHCDGGLLVTTGMNHQHESSTWEDASTPRVTYAFDIVNAERWRADRIQVPFDGAFD